jgi:hypothetical protein
MNIPEQIHRNIQDLPLDKQKEVLDFVLLLRDRAENVPEPREKRQEILRDSLENLARMKTFAGIEDPVEWQRDLRRDRSLPGREE